MQDGSRRITQVTEIVGLENDVVSMQDLFVFQHQGMRDGKVAGKIVPTGLRPHFMEQIQQHNLHLSPQIFGGNSSSFMS
jgi:pilus assembly protein CpaF